MFDLINSSLFKRRREPNWQNVMQRLHISTNKRYEVCHHYQYEKAMEDLRQFNIFCENMWMCLSRLTLVIYIYSMWLGCSEYLWIFPTWNITGTWNITFLTSGGRPELPVVRMLRHFTELQLLFTEMVGLSQNGVLVVTNLGDVVTMCGYLCLILSRHFMNDINHTVVGITMNDICDQQHI